MEEADRTSSISAAPETTLAAGALVGRYVVLDVIGRGGMGVVYAAYDAQLGRKIAVKLLRTSLASIDGSDAQARILREAQAMARLSHPNVVAVYDVGAYGDDNVFLAMDLVEGSTLKTWLETPRTWRETLDVMKQAGRGLAAAHVAGLVHRDFKPDNVLIGNDGRARVTDFGIARTEGRTDEPDTVALEVEPPSVTAPSGLSRSVPPESQPDQRSAAPARTAAAAPGAEPGPAPVRAPPVAAQPCTPEPTPSGRDALAAPITVTGTILGTVGYMPPEQGMSEEVGPRSDQFSFCVTLYIALFGERPFPGESMEDYLNALERHVPTPPKSSGVPAWVRKIVLKGLSRRPSDRHASMDALLSALENDPAQARRRIAGWLVVALSLLAVVGAFRRWSQQGQKICATDPTLLAGAWDGDVKERVHRAFLATGAPLAEETYERVAQKLDAHAEGWTATRNDACEATLIRHDKSMDVMAVRMACLDRSKTELAALTAVFAKADAQVLRRAVAATFNLSTPASCANVNGLQAQVGLPDDKETRDRVVSARADLARAESLRLSGKYKDALAVAEPTLAAARAIPHAETEAEVLYSIGQTRELVGDYAGTEQPYEDAVFAAERAGNDALLARTSARLAFVIGDKLARPREAEAWIHLAEAAVARLGPNDDVEGDVLQVKAVLFTTVGRPDIALPLQERIVAIREKTLGPSHLMTARALNNLGYTFQLLAEQDKALGPHLRSLSIREAVFGADDPALAVDYSNIGSSELGLSRYDDAIASLRHAIDIGSRGNPNSFWVAWASQFLSVALTRSGDPRGGLDAAQRGLAVIANVKSEEERVTPPLLVGEGLALLALGRAAEAATECTRAVSMQDAAGAFNPDRVYEWDALDCIGAADLALGKPKDALSPLSRSVGLERRQMAGDLARARFDLARALAATGEAPRAKELAEQAKTELSALPVRPGVLDAVEGFLASR